MRFTLAKEEQRDISLVQLDLPQDVALNILHFVNKSVQPEYMTYLYHHYNENCSTKIRDIINEATDGKFKEWAMSIPSSYTIRELVSFHTASHPFIHFTLNFLQSKSIDTPITLWEEMFLPEKLEKAVMNFEFETKEGVSTPLAKEREIINLAPVGMRPLNNQSKFRANLIMVLCSLLLSILIFISKRIMKNTIYNGIYKFYSSIYSILSISWTLIASVFSLVLTFMMVVSNHDVTYFNENILIISPLSILMFISVIHYTFSKKEISRFFEYLNTISFFLIILLIIAKGVFPDYLYQENYEIMLIAMPLYLVNSTFLRPLLKKRRKVINNNTW
jgi:hypothetical protein